MQLKKSCDGCCLIRGIASKKTDKSGNFWVDMVRGTLYVLLPMSLLMTAILGAAALSMKRHGF